MTKKIKYICEFNVGPGWKSPSNCVMSSKTKAEILLLAWLNTTGVIGSIKVRCREVINEED